MQKRIILFLLLTLLTLSSAFSQIVNPDGKETKPSEEKVLVEKVKKTRNVDSVTQLYFNSNFSVTNRTLTPNGELFGKPLGTRADETSANFWSFSAGIRNQMSKHFALEVGLGWTRNGEKYSYEQSDSNYNYTTRYSFLTMPVVGYFTYGKDIQLFAGAGLMPQLFMSQFQEFAWTSKNNTKYKDESKEKGGTPNHTAMTASALFRVGVQLKYSTFWSLYFIPEYRLQLGSTYGKNSAYIHKASAFGFNLGLTYQL